MKIKSLELENFRSCPDGVYNLDKINLLIGPNGRGKTSLQKGLRYILNGNTQNSYIRSGKDHLHVSAVLDDGQDTKIERYLYLPDTYQINGEDVKQTAFQKEVDKYRDKYNSSGTIPTLQSRTNDFFRSCSPDVIWDFLKKGKVEGVRLYGKKELEVEMFDGKVFYIQKSKPSKASVDGKTVTVKAMNALIEDRMQGDTKVLDLVTSSDIMSAIEMKDFAQYLLSIIPVKMNFSILKEHAKLDDAEVRILEPLFPAAPAAISTVDVADVYKALFNMRTSIARNMDEEKKRSEFPGNLPLLDKDEVQHGLDMINQQLGMIKQLEVAWDVYQKQSDKRKSAIATLNTWKQEYNSMVNVHAPRKGELQSLQERESELQQDIDMLLQGNSRLQQTNIPLSKMLKNLDSTICPLCDRLVCNTDKTSCRADIQKMIWSNQDLIKQGEQQIQTKRSELDIVKKQQETVREAENRYKAKVDLYHRYMDLHASVPDEPVKPQPIPSVDSLLEKKKRYTKYLEDVILFDKCQKAYEKYVALKHQYDVYTNVLKKAEPKKGLLTNTILEYLLLPFSTHINHFIKSIYGDMELSFRVDDTGLQVYCRPHGRDCFLAVNDLSTGEKIMAVFALMDMVSNISNARILAFDSLESLDQSSLNALLKVLTSQEVLTRYDHIFLAVVGHDSIRHIMEPYKEQLNVFTFD